MITASPYQYYASKNKRRRKKNIFDFNDHSYNLPSPLWYQAISSFDQTFGCGGAPSFQTNPILEKFWNSCTWQSLFLKTPDWKSLIQLRGERILFFGPNTNTNNIRNQILDRIRIRIIFVFSEWANTNTNNIRAQIFGRIRTRIIFRFRIVPEYEYE